jgi:glycosyltransferase involved in cell wall biosynthesis
LAGKNISFSGHVSFSMLHHELRSARAFVFAAYEDFGIAPVEAQACGTPVIALGRGGTSETVLDPARCGKNPPTGVHFHDQSVDSILAAIDRFVSIEDQLCHSAIRANAEKFSVDRFRTGFSDLVSRVMTSRSTT